MLDTSKKILVKFKPIASRCQFAESSTNLPQTFRINHEVKAENEVDATDEATAERETTDAKTTDEVQIPWTHDSALQATFINFGMLWQ